MKSLQCHTQSLLIQGCRQGKPQGKRSRTEKGAHRIRGGCRIQKTIEGREALGIGKFLWEGTLEDSGIWGVGDLRA